MLHTHPKAKPQHMKQNNTKYYTCTNDTQNKTQNNQKRKLV